MRMSSGLARLARSPDDEDHRQGRRRQEDGVQESGGAEIESQGPAEAHVRQFDQRKHMLVHGLEEPLGSQRLSAGNDGHPTRFISPGRGQPVPAHVRQGRGRHDGPDGGDEPSRPPGPASAEGDVFAAGKAMLCFPIHGRLAWCGHWPVLAKDSSFRPPVTTQLRRRGKMSQDDFAIGIESCYRQDVQSYAQSLVSRKETADSVGQVLEECSKRHDTFPATSDLLSPRPTTSASSC